MASSYTSTYVWTGAGDGTNWNNPANWTYYDQNGNPAPYPLTWVNGQQVAVPPGDSANWASVAFPSSTTVNMDGKTWSGVNSLTVSSSATVTLENGSVQTNGLTVNSSATLALNGITLTVPSSATVDGTLEIENGATVTLNGSVAGSVVFGDTPNNTHNTLVLSNSSLSVGSVQNFTPGDSIVVDQTSYPHVRWIEQGTSNTWALVPVDSTNWTQKAILTSISFAPKRDASGAIITQNGAPVYYSPLDLSPAPTAQGTITGNQGDSAYTGSTYIQDAGFVYNSATSTGTVTCFLAGSMIRTTKGDVPVEDVRVGDLVITLTNGTPEALPVIWAGYQTMSVQPGLPDDEAGYPVRIRAGAIADGVPYKDMLITPEHCLYLEGRFVPVRMLVNGDSIFYDRSLTEYTYYHVETVRHAVIVADGMLTESYLDTGNRRSFAQKEKTIILGGIRRSWAHDAAAPLCADRAEVEPLFQALAHRARLEGSEGITTVSESPALQLTHEANLHLETECGKTIQKIRDVNGLVSFMLPAGVERVRLVSRAARPCDVTGPFVDDRRTLGVLVGDVTLLEGNLAPRSIMPDAGDTSLPGWHAAENNGARWTNGFALLPVPTTLPHAITMVTLNILAAGPYLTDTAAAHQNRAHG
ncbi:Hint domain-containing protein [Acetobacter farinalis]|uniref:Hint domain-containing protein n=1 Tax=Acetobacter farinalis TaxID=1260984 RepID=A0ABT3Q9Z8_9PROT|nr:Hint domain-containing protein [Acetobacter farinalis]MCX2562097.1 Hint domain-containing protein [Acetobacter farinalis]NHO30731.1 hypothetical protein [Acetobacter farinalis]